MATFKSTILERIEFEVDGIPGGLPLVFDDWSLAFHLGLRGRTLWYTALHREKMYKVFEIPKATGGKRVIHDPTKLMRVVARQLRVRILLPLCNVLGEHVGAYQLGRSTRDTAARHIAPCATCEPHDTHTCTAETDTREDGQLHAVRVGREDCLGCQMPPAHLCPRRGVKIHMDLKNFFGSTRRSWIRNYFHEVIGYNHYVSGLLAQLMTVPLSAAARGGKLAKWDGVPQGAPFSGDITNLVCDWRLDRQLVPALKRRGWTYSRYADDLYLSHPENLPREDVDATIALVEDHINAAGYRTNRKKLHVQRPGSRQQVLGCVVNQKVNVKNDLYRRLRALVHNCYRQGFELQVARAKKENIDQLQSWLGGQLSYLTMIAPEKIRPLRLMYDAALEAWPAPVLATAQPEAEPAAEDATNAVAKLKPWSKGLKKKPKKPKPVPKPRPRAKPKKKPKAQAV